MNQIHIAKNRQYKTQFYQSIVTLLLVIICGQLSAGIIYTNCPANGQLYGRNVATNQAIISVSGIVEGAAIGNQIELRVYRAENLFDTQTHALIYENDKANFSFQTAINAELVNYRFEVYTISAGAYTLDKTVTNIVAGDAYIIDGQSNALAYRRAGATSASAEESQFIRSFASGVNNITVGNNLNWYQGNADGTHNTNGNIGQWGAKMASMLVSDYQIPIAIFNGAYGGTPINYHARNDNSPTDLATNYGRLLYRIQQAKLADKVRAIIWYQGETDAKYAMSLQTYKNRFYTMYEGWANDFSNFEQLYIIQIRKSCNGNKYYFGRIQEAHRQLARELPKAKLMTAKGIGLWTDDCHFSYLNGYEKVGERIANGLKNDLYNANTPHALPPDILTAEFTNPTTLMITTTNPQDVLVWESGAEADFHLIGSSASVTSGTVQNNRLYLTVTGNSNSIYGVTYFGRSGIGVTAPYVKNTAGIGMASFYDFPVGEPVMSILDDNYALNEDTLLIGDISYNDNIINSSGWIMNPLVNDVNFGTLSLQTNGEFTYTPDENFNGIDDFIYEICSAARPDYCEQAKVQITVNPIDDAPYAYDNLFGIMQNNIATGNILTNDKEVDGHKIILDTNPIAPPTNGNVLIEALGDFTYTPNMNFYGADKFAYQICDDTPTGLCDTAWVTIQINVNAANNTNPIAVIDALTLNEDAVKSGNLISNDSDPDGHDLLVTPTPLTLPLSGDAIVLTSGQYYYLPDPNFNGVDSFTYEICDTGIPSLCDTAWVMVNVLPVNDTPFAVNDTIYNNAFDASIINILDNDFDPDEDDLNIMPNNGFGGLNGELIIQANGVVNYQPMPGFVGTEQFTYEICDTGTPPRCDEATVTIIVESDCIHIDLQALMQGAYNPQTQEMSTELNTARGLLPGQTPASDLVSATLAGQPYSIAPWNYAGQEGADWANDDYTDDMVDWVLVSFRLSEDKASEIAQTAALLNKDASIYFPNRCVLSADLTAPMYVVIEHRNHIGIMSPQPVPISNQVINYDFRAADSYKDASGYGQEEISAGVWAMFAGDGYQFDEFSYDINGEDKQIWFDQNGIFDIYLPADYNLDGDVNGVDKGYWMDNNGISSRVPK